MHANQPLSSVEAFALALVEASSRLGSTADATAGDGGTLLPVPRVDEAAAAAE